MKQIGITRKYDQLGRIVIPIELRRALCWDRDTPITITRMGQYILLRSCDADDRVCARVTTKSPLFRDLTAMLASLSDEDFMRIHDLVQRLTMQDSRRGN